MPNQLYIQAKALVSLCEENLQTMLIEYPQSHPSELGNIEIYADAKDIKVTPFEEYWKIAILPELQSRSSRKPLGMIAGADYSHFDKMYRGEAAAVPSHLADLFPSRGRPYEYTDIGWIFRNIHIEQSHEHIGLQLVDIVANCLTRILKENIQPAGWRKFPRLFLRKTAGALTLITFLPTKGPPPPYQKQAKYIHQNARTAAVHRFPKPSNRSIAMHGRKNT